MRIHDSPSKANIGSSSAVVRALRVWEPSNRPAKWPLVEGPSNFEEGIFLLNSEPRFLIRRFVHDLVTKESEVGICRPHDVFLAVDNRPALGQYKNVITLPEGVWEVGNGLEDYLRTIGSGLLGGAPVEVPFR